MLIGVLAPLSPPGWTEAGLHLVAGIEQGVCDVNAAGGIGGRPLELLVRDTAADPRKAGDAVDELARRGVAAIAGEYHSVAARAAAGRAEALGLPFLCSSAVLDALTESPAAWVARLAPAQSHGWRLYAEFLLRAGHRRIAVAAQASPYWAAGVGVLRDRLTGEGVDVIELDANALDPSEVCAALAELHVTGALLLVGHPEPAVTLVRAIRSDRRLGGVMIGAPAGQPEFEGWAAALGADGAGIPFLRYRPERFGALGTLVEGQLRERLGAAPSFVAFEGYDTVVVLADILRRAGESRRPVDCSQVMVEGSRGCISFERVTGISVWQWAWAPIQIVERDVEEPDRFRVLYSA